MPSLFRAARQTEGAMDAIRMSESNEPQRAEPGARRLIPVPVSTLRCAVLDYDLYVQRGDSPAPVLYRARTQPLEQTDLDRLEKRGVHTLYIALVDHKTYRDQALEAMARQKELPSAERFRILRDVSRGVFEAAYRTGTMDDMVEVADDFGSGLADTLGAADLILPDLFALMEHDNETFTHSVNVATYSLILAKGLGILDPDELNSMAAGALLHDIGKREIRREILNTPGPLTGQQREIIQQHPVFGFKALFLRPGIAWGPLMMVYQHHERVDGQGYPVRLEGQ